LFRGGWPFYGQRKLLVLLREAGFKLGRKKVRRLMRVMGMEAVAPKRRTSLPDDKHRKYPYLLGGLEITAADQVWCADITYIPMERGFGYLVAIMDWHTRAVLAWRLSNTLDTRFCLEALAEAVLVAGGVPDIFNTDQGCQFTSREWIGALEGLGVRVSMDGTHKVKGRKSVERFYSPRRKVVLGRGQTCSVFYWSNLNIKDTLARLRRNQDPDSGPVWEVPDDIDDEYLAQMEGEHRIKKNGKWLWERIGSRPNHYLDNESMQVAAATMLKIVGREAVMEAAPVDSPAGAS
jgi:transposase InsO family protein